MGRTLDAQLASYKPYTRTQFTGNIIMRRLVGITRSQEMRESAAIVVCAPHTHTHTDVCVHFQSGQAMIESDFHMRAM